MKEFGRAIGKVARDLSERKLRERSMIARMRGAVRGAGSRDLRRGGIRWIASAKVGYRGLELGGFSFLTTRLCRFGQPAFTRSLASLGGP